MKRFFILVILLPFLCVKGYSQSADEAWTTLYSGIESKIKVPDFKKKDFNIKKFGAVPDNPDKLNHDAINNAIKACSESGGGRVVVPKGVWHTGPIRLKSNVNLYLSEGSTLLFTTDTAYFPVVLTRWEGNDCYNLQPLIYAHNETNIALTGKGTIDGAGENETWWKKCGAVRFGWKEGDISQRTGRPKLMQWNIDRTPIEQRILTGRDGIRPQMVNFYGCQNILIEDVKLIRSPFWVLHPLLCNNVTIRGVHIQNNGPNGDGCDPESCTNVLIENCFFDTGDDCIAIKAGRNNDGRAFAKPSENFIVRNCEMKNGHGGVVIGSEITGGYKNLFVENCNMDSPDLDRVIRIKTNMIRGGVIENIYVRNVTVGQCREAVLKINLLYEPREPGDRIHYPIVRNVYMDNVTCQKSQYGVFIDALPDKLCVYNINVLNSTFEGVTKKEYLVNGLTESINFTNLIINGNLVGFNQ